MTNTTCKQCECSPTIGADYCPACHRAYNSFLLADIASAEKTPFEQLLQAMQVIADAEDAGLAYPGDGWKLAHAKFAAFARAAIAKAKGE